MARQMNQQVTEAIVLSRIDYGEADRIITLLTPASGKLRLIAKGVRRIKSRLAGGIELFSVTNVTYIPGRGDIGTLVSSRLVTYYGKIVTDIDRTMLGYELTKQLNKVTEDVPEADYFHLLQAAFAALDDASIGIGLIRVWFSAQLLRLNGHTPNLVTEPTGARLMAGQTYGFSFDDMAFVGRSDGIYTTANIKFLRLVFGNVTPRALTAIVASDQQVQAVGQLIATLERS